MMTKLIEMRDRMAKLATDARAKLDEITDKTEAARAKEIEGEFDKIMSDHDDLAARVERAEKIEAVEQRQAADDAKGDPRRPKQEDSEVPAAEDQRKAPEYKEVFTKAIRFGAATLDSEERQVLMDGRADIPQEIRAQAAGTDASGGFTVPEGFSGEIDKALAAWGPMLDASFVRQYPTATGNPVPWPTVDYTAIRGGIKAENAAATDDGGNDIVFGQKVLNAYLYDSEVVRVSLELLQDSAFSMDSLLTELFGESLGRTVNDVLTVGDGTNKPNGIVTASGAGPTTASGTAITADELIDLQHSVDPAYRQSPNVRWQFNDSTLKAIRKLKDGQGNYLWQLGDVRGSEPSTILGNPYAVNQAMADIGVNAKAVIFGDMSRYVVRRAGQLQMIALRERYMESLQVGYISFMRIDGELLNNSAVKHLLQAAI